MPSNLENNYIILAAHSGNNKNAYFNDVDKLKMNDEITIIKNQKEYIFRINQIYLINKTGYLKIKNTEKNKLILITCSKTTKNKQLILISNLINIKNVK